MGGGAAGPLFGYDASSADGAPRLMFQDDPTAPAPS